VQENVDADILTRQHFPSAHKEAAGQIITLVPDRGIQGQLARGRIQSEEMIAIK
jgi:hypothetical protein